MRSIARAAVCALAVAASAVVAAQEVKRGAHDASVQRGRYLAVIGGCNDCHTEGYAQKAGKVPETEWLTGNREGFKGPWGTTYPANLRLAVQGMSEAEWMKHARKPTRPPMPWFNLRDMSDQDVRALHRYIKSLGPGGNPAPAYVPPGQTPMTPYIDFGPSAPPAK